MPSVRARPALIALLAILAIAVAAATLNSAVATHEGFGPGSGAGGASGGGSGQGSEEGQARPSIGLGNAEGMMPVIPLPCFPILNDPRFLFGVAIAVLAISYALYRRAGLIGPVGFVAIVGPPAVFVHLLLTACREASDARLSFPSPGGANNSSAFSIGAGAASGGGAQSGGTPAVTLFLFAVLGIALVAAVVLLFQSTDDDIQERPEEEPSIDPEQMAAIGRAAGRAADRIEDDADADNAVYQAWKDMTAHLDVERPESSTPAEFAGAAVDAGMNPADVRELTALFEEVRYGEAEPTPDREERALSALRRIEDEYAGAGEDE